VILTRQKGLPNVGNTETLAYGEQITVEILKLDRPLEAWIAWRIPDGDPLVILKQRGLIDGRPALKVEQETEAGKRWTTTFSPATEPTSSRSIR